MTDIIKKKEEKEFIYHSRANNGLRRFTILAIVNDGTLRIGHSVVCEKDIFTKALGRKIAKGRVYKKPIEILSINGKNESEISASFYMYARSFATIHKNLLKPPVKKVKY